LEKSYSARQLHRKIESTYKLNVQVDNNKWRCVYKKVGIRKHVSMLLPLLSLTLWGFEQFRGSRVHWVVAFRPLSLATTLTASVPIARRRLTVKYISSRHFLCGTTAWNLKTICKCPNIFSLGFESEFQFVIFPCARGQAPPSCCEPERIRVESNSHIRVSKLKILMECVCEAFQKDL